jgi:hypothetical protein
MDVSVIYISLQGTIRITSVPESIHHTILNILNQVVQNDFLGMSFKICPVSGMPMGEISWRIESSPKKAKVGHVARPSLILLIYFMAS